MLQRHLSVYGALQSIYNHNACPSSHNPDQAHQSSSAEVVLEAIARHLNHGDGRGCHWRRHSQIRSHDTSDSNRYWINPIFNGHRYGDGGQHRDQRAVAHEHRDEPARQQEQGYHHSAVRHAWAEGTYQEVDHNVTGPGLDKTVSD